MSGNNLLWRQFIPRNIEKRYSLHCDLSQIHEIKLSLFNGSFSKLQFGRQRIFHLINRNKCQGRISFKCVHQMIGKVMKILIWYRLKIFSFSHASVV